MLTLTSHLITRHPVYDERGELFGFQLAASGGVGEGAGGPLDEASSARAIVQGVLSGALEGLAAGTRMVLEVSADLLMGQFADLLPAASAAVKLPPSALPEPALVDALEDIRTRGGLVILSGFLPGDPRTPLLAHADAVGVDLSGDRHRGRLPRRGHAGGLPMLAEGIDTAEAFEVARELGCTWYQGGVFVGSAILERTGPPGFRPVHVSLLEAVSRPDIDFAKLERVIKQDVQLTHAFLRYVNSAAFGWRSRIESLAHAFVLLGEGAVRNWATLVVMADMAADRPQQMAVTAGVRARFCELLGADAGTPAQPLELFTLGMFSLIDVLLGRPMREVLAELPLSEPVHEALLGADNGLRSVLDAVVAYEEGDWHGLGEALGALGADDDRLLEHYLSAVDWAAGTFDRVLAD